jgi:hypothetical protein
MIWLAAIRRTVARRQEWFHEGDALEERAFSDAIVA